MKGIVHAKKEISVIKYSCRSKPIIQLINALNITNLLSYVLSIARRSPCLQGPPIHLRAMRKKIIYTFFYAFEKLIHSSQVYASIVSIKVYFYYIKVSPALPVGIAAGSFV